MAILAARTQIESPRSGPREHPYPLLLATSYQHHPLPNPRVLGGVRGGPESNLMRKGNGQPGKLSYRAQALMDNRNALCSDIQVRSALNPETTAAKDLRARQGRKRIRAKTRESDKRHHARDFVQHLRKRSQDTLLRTGSRATACPPRGCGVRRVAPESLGAYDGIGTSNEHQSSEKVHPKPSSKARDIDRSSDDEGIGAVFAESFVNLLTVRYGLRKPYEH